jgi:hypothetical protein
LTAERLWLHESWQYTNEQNFELSEKLKASKGIQAQPKSLMAFGPGDARR